MIVKELGEEPGLRLFRDIVRSNGLSVRKGHTLLAGLVASGEILLALTTYSHGAEKMKQRGAPVEWFAIAPAIGARTASASWRSRRTRTPRRCSPISCFRPRARRSCRKAATCPPTCRSQTGAEAAAQVRRPCADPRRAREMEEAVGADRAGRGAMSADAARAGRTCLLLFDFLEGHANRDAAARERYRPVIANAAALAAAARAAGAMVAYANADHRADHGTVARTLRDTDNRLRPLTVENRAKVTAGDRRRHGEGASSPSSRPSNRLHRAEAPLERVPRHLPRPRAARAACTRCCCAAARPTSASPQPRSPRAISTTTC